MKSALLIKLILLFIVTSLLSACVVQSTHPFYTKSHSVISPPSIQGEWFKDNVSEPWLIKGKRVTSYGKGNVKNTIIVHFFKVNGVLYSDSSPGDVDNKKINIYWAFHISPNHLLSRVTISGTRLTFEPLSPKNLNTLIKQHNLAIPSTLRTGDPDKINIYYAKPATWIKFLTQYGSTPGLFNSKDAIILKRKKS